MNALLFFAACLGNLALLVFALNRAYALALPRKLLSGIRALVALGIVGFPAWLWMAFGFEVDRAWREEPLLRVYLSICWIIGLAWAPALTLTRLLRRRPKTLLSNHTRTLDVAGELGYKPIGGGKYRHLARLPRNEVFRVDFCERTLQIPELPPAWDGLSILHLSDLHFAGSPDKIFYQKVMDECRAWEPDLLALTGDFLDRDDRRRWIVPLLGRLRWRIAAFAVLGNHDKWHEPNLLRRRLSRINIHVLGNTWKQIEVRGLPMIVIGHEGPWFRPAPDLSDCPLDVFRLCVSHTPDNLGWAQGNHVRLMLSGHNHGGQVRFPLIGSVFVPSLHGRRFDCGAFEVPPTVLHVSRGLAGKQPLRYNCPPEVTKLILRSRPCKPGG
jgi:uncharacterized protein